MEGQGAWRSESDQMGSEPPPPSPAPAHSSPSSSGAMTTSLQLQKLAALERTLERKEKAMRVLQRRVEVQRAGHGHMPSSRETASQLAVLQHEVDLLRRDCKLEGALLATTEKRAERMQMSSADEAGLAAATALAAAADANIAAAEAEVAADAAHRASMHARAVRAIQAAEVQGKVTKGYCESGEASGGQVGSPRQASTSAIPRRTMGEPAASRGNSRGSASEVRRLPLAWTEYREAQKIRQDRLKQSLRASWRAADTALDAMKQAAPARVDTRLSPRVVERLAQASDERQQYIQSLSLEQRERAQQLTQAIENSSPAIEFRLNQDVEEFRQESRALQQEVRKQRSREWARQGANLRRMRDETAPRIDDRFSLEVAENFLAASPLQAMMADAKRRESQYEPARARSERSASRLSN